MSKKITALIPGAALALGIACIAKWLETLESSAGLHLIGASVIALFIGMAINAFFQPNKTTAPGIKFTSKKVLKFAIVLLGASLNIRTVLTVGRFFADGHALHPGHLLWTGRADRQSARAQLENQQPDQRRNRHLRRLCHCGHRARH